VLKKKKKKKIKKCNIQVLCNNYVHLTDTSVLSDKYRCHHKLDVYIYIFNIYTNWFSDEVKHGRVSFSAR
jgi:hypothetical protein